MQPVCAQHRGHTQIGQHEPLCRAGIGVNISPRHPRRQRINARRLIHQHIAQGQPRDHVAVQFPPDLARPGPNLSRDLGGEAARLPFGHRAAKVILLHRADQVAVTDAGQRQVDPIKIHRLHRQSRIRAARQHISAPRKHDRRRTVAHIKHLLHITHERLTTRRRQTRAQHDPVALAVLNTVHAQLVLISHHRQRRIGQVHERCVILPRLDQRLGKLRTDARRGTVAFHRIADHAEPVLTHGLLQRAVQIVARRDALRQPERGDHVAPPLCRLQSLRHHLQRAHPLGCVARPQIAVHSRTHPALAQAYLLIIILRGYPRGQPRILHP